MCSRTSASRSVSKSPCMTLFLTIEVYFPISLHSYVEIILRSLRTNAIPTMPSASSISLARLWRLQRVFRLPSKAADVSIAACSIEILSPFSNKDSALSNRPLLSRIFSISSLNLVMASLKIGSRESQSTFLRNPKPFWSPLNATTLANVTAATPKSAASGLSSERWRNGSCETVGVPRCCVGGLLEAERSSCQTKITNRTKTPSITSMVRAASGFHAALYPYYLNPASRVLAPNAGTNQA